MTETKLGFSHVGISQVVDELGVVHANSTHHLQSSVVMDGGDASLLEELGAELGITDSKSELLLLGAL